MHLIGSDIQVMSVFCRGWRNLILVGSILKFSLLNVSMNTFEENGEESHLCCSYDIGNACMYFVSLEVAGRVTGKNSVCVGRFLFFAYLNQPILP